MKYNVVSRPTSLALYFRFCPSLLLMSGHLVVIAVPPPPAVIHLGHLVIDLHVFS